MRAKVTVGIHFCFRWMTVAAVFAGMYCPLPATADWSRVSLPSWMPNPTQGRIFFEDEAAGTFWIASGSMVYGFDRIAWTVLPSPLSAIQTLLVDSSGAVWIGGEVRSNCDGRSCFRIEIARYKDGEWTRFPEVSLGAPRDVTSLVEGPGGSIWALLSGSILRFQQGAWGAFPIDDLVRVQVLRGSSGAMWFCGVGGAARYEGGALSVYPTSYPIMDVFEDVVGTLWLADAAGQITSFDGDTWRTIIAPQSTPTIQRMSVDSLGNIWIGAAGGVAVRYDGFRWDTFSNPWYGGGSSWTFDSKGGMWSWGGPEISYFDRSTWETVANIPFPEGRKSSILIDSTGRIWVNNGYSDGLNVTSDRGLSWVTSFDSLWVSDIIEDPSGAIWTCGDVLSRFDGLRWEHYAHGGDRILMDHSGVIWLVWGDGVFRFDGSEFVELIHSLGYYFSCIEEGPDEALWFGTSAEGAGYGVLRYDGSGFSRFDTSDGLVDNNTLSIYRDSKGSLWFGSEGGRGITRFDGTAWQSFSNLDGLVTTTALEMIEDHEGAFWVAGRLHVSRLKDGVWGTPQYPNSSLPFESRNNRAIAEDASGILWVGTDDGLFRHQPDRISPRTVIVQSPPWVSASTFQTVSFATFPDEPSGITFAVSVDGAPWSGWSISNTWTGQFLSHGDHVFRVRAKDGMGNVDPDPVELHFEIDDQPPQPIISFPAFGEAVRDSLEIVGTATDLRFKTYRLELRPSGSDLPWTLLTASSLPVTKGVLGSLNTAEFPDGPYELLLSVTDTLGATGGFPITVIVDNHFPYADQTSPAFVSAQEGGDVFTTNQEAHLFIPPRALAADATVSITLTDAKEAPPEIDGTQQVLAGFSVSWGGQPLRKPAILDIALTGIDGGSQAGDLAIYGSSDQVNWVRLGGTLTPDRTRLSTAVSWEGTYGVYAGTQIPSSPAPITAIQLSPRVFSPRGTATSTELAISFGLPRPSQVTIKVISRSGRMVRELASGMTMNQGTNVIRWDGRGYDGAIVSDGLYIVTVESNEGKQTKTVAVVR